MLISLVNVQSNPKVYLDLQLGRSSGATPLGRVVVELKADVVPKTAENFKQLSEAEPGNGLKGSRFHRIITDFMCQVHVTSSTTQPRMNHCWQQLASGLAFVQPPIFLQGLE